MIVAACDPGAVTGVAIYGTDDREFESFETTQNPCAWLSACSVVVCEQFTITEDTARKTAQPDALHWIGTIKAFCRENNIELVMQGVGAKKFARPNKLKLLGWALKTPDNHADDASAHLLRYLEKNALLHPQDRIKLFGAFK